MEEKVYNTMAQVDRRQITIFPIFVSSIICTYVYLDYFSRRNIANLQCLFYSFSRDCCSFRRSTKTFILLLILSRFSFYRVTFEIIDRLYLSFKLNKNNWKEIRETIILKEFFKQVLASISSKKKLYLTFQLLITIQRQRIYLNLVHPIIFVLEIQLTRLKYCRKDRKIS